MHLLHFREREERFIKNIFTENKIWETSLSNNYIYIYKFSNKVYFKKLDYVIFTKEYQKENWNIIQRKKKILNFR